MSQLSEEDEFSEIMQAAQEFDKKMHKQKVTEQRFDTKTKNADKLKDVMESQKANIKPSTIRQVMFERIEEGLNTKIPKENKGFQLLMKLGFKEGETLGKKQKGLIEPLQIDFKPNKHGIEFMDPKKARMKEKVKMMQKYSAELSEGFVNLKKHEFIMKKLKKKLNDCLKYLTTQPLNEYSLHLIELLQYLINEDIPFQPHSDKIEGLGKRIQKEESDIDLDTLLSVLSESRVYIREAFNYCVTCRYSGIDKEPCKHCEPKEAID